MVHLVSGGSDGDGGGGEGGRGGWRKLGVGLAAPTRMMRSSSLQPLMRRSASSVLSLWWAG